MDEKIEHRYPVLRKYWWVVPLVLTITGLIIWSIPAWRTTEYVADKNSMMFGDVTEGIFYDYLRITGRVETGTTVQLSALESGIVDKKWVEEGAQVNSGDVILSLRNPALRQQILDSESQLAERQNMLRDTEITMEKEKLQLKRDILAARTDLNRMQRTAEQKERLYEEKLCSREEYLIAQEDLQLAKENLKLIEDRLSQDSLYRSVQLSMMRESLRNMQENFQLVRQRADNLDIKASHSGQLGRLSAELGQSISSGQQIGQINILDNYKLTVMIDEHFIDRVEEGLTGTAGKGATKYDVFVSKIYPEVTDGKFKVDLEFAGKTPDNIRVGQSYIVDIQTGEPKTALMIPRGTFYASSGGRYVYVVSEDGKSADKRDVKIDRQNPKYYEVSDGLASGEKVIISNYTDFGEADRIIIK